MQMTRLIIAALLALTIAGPAWADFKVEQFLQLDAAEQDRILIASYNSSTVMLAMGMDEDGKLGPVKMSACLKDRELGWLRKTFLEYISKYYSKHNLSPIFGANFVHSMAWKCGFLTISE